MGYLKTVFTENFKALFNDRPELKKSELADYLKVTRATVSRWANGTSLPETDCIEKIAHFCNVSPSYFFMSNEVVAPKDDWQIFINEIAKKSLSESLFTSYCESGPVEFLKILRMNYETDSITAPAWYFPICDELKKYTSINLVEKIQKATSISIKQV